MANLVFIPNTTSKGSTVGLKLEDIPEDVRTDAEGVYEALKTQNGRMRVNFETVAEMNTYISQITAYCNLREVDGKPAPIRFRKSPTRKLPPTTMDFKITDVVTENEAVAADINKTVEEVKAVAAGKTPASK